MTKEGQMPVSLPTIRIQNPKLPDQFMLINKIDFDENKYVIWDSVITIRMKAEAEMKAKKEEDEKQQLEANIKAKEEAEIDRRVEEKIKEKANADAEKKAKENADAIAAEKEKENNELNTEAEATIEKKRGRPAKQPV